MNIEIYTDAGRCTEPLYIIENNNFLIDNTHLRDIKNHKIKWNNLIVGSLDSTKNQILSGVIRIYRCSRTRSMYDCH